MESKLKKFKTKEVIIKDNINGGLDPRRYMNSSNRTYSDSVNTSADCYDIVAKSNGTIDIYNSDTGADTPINGDWNPKKTWATN
jgi:hypothetical protein